ncbi:uncharacterized protein [Parasteatoda tepidariorum]|uniref:uncharacterized protein n=1 Tax=Parasteatoda tepidariorum TaxID=114398 RepID=UPI0039BC4D4E
MDSTPDLSHNDQLAIVLRYCFREKVYERCVSFIKISSHTDLHLINILQDFLETNGLLLDNCRGQSYDNAANMAGQNNGVQALLKQKNKSADYVSCAAHSLNLVGEESVKVATKIMNFFGSPGLDICEGSKLIVPLKDFVNNIRHQSDQKLKEYEEKAKKLSTRVGIDINKRRITPKFSVKSTDKFSVYGTEKFKRKKLNVALDKLIMDLNKRSQVYEMYSKKFKFLMDLQDKNMENLDLESAVRNIVDYYPDDVD